MNENLVNLNISHLFKESYWHTDMNSEVLRYKNKFTHLFRGYAMAQ
jgi:hypothetical protein